MSCLGWETPLKPKSKQVRPGGAEPETCMLKTQAFPKYGKTAVTSWTELLSSSMDPYAMSTKHCTQTPWLYIFPCAVPVFILSLNYVNACLGWIYPMGLYHWGVHANHVFFSFFLCFVTSVLLKPEMPILSNPYVNFTECFGWGSRVLEFAETHRDV